MQIPRPLLALLALTVSVSAADDAPPPDASQLLAFLKTLKDQQATQIKTAKGKVLREAQAAAASPAAAASAWVEAVRLTQFEGAEKEGAKFREWRDGEGAAFTELPVQKATQLYFRWLVLTMQRSMGTPVSELMPAVIQFTKDMAADREAMEDFSERAEKEKQLAQSRMHGNRKDTSGDDIRTRRAHDQVIDKAVNAGPIVALLHAEDLLKIEKWEMTPGNVDGIFTNIVLPELRINRDVRVLEYWDMKIKRRTDRMKERPAFEQEKFTKEGYPDLLWSRAREYVLIGQPNRGMGEMLKILRAYPQHPNLSGWIDDVEKLLSPAPAPSAPAGTSEKSK